MKSPCKRLLCSVLTICLLSSMLCTFASAADARSSDYLDSYVASVVPKSGGKIVVCATVDAIVNATMIGVTDVYLYESSNDVDFTCVEHFSYEDYPDMVSTGRGFHADVATYNGTVGKYYYAAVYVYAGTSAGGDTRVYNTASEKAIA